MGICGKAGSNRQPTFVQPFPERVSQSKSIYIIMPHSSLPSNPPPLNVSLSNPQGQPRRLLDSLPRPPGARRPKALSSHRR
jgi:hypothetical protein